MKIAAALVALFVMLGGAVAGSYALAASAARHATANAASVRQLCQAGNEARRQQVALWEKLIALSVPPPGETAAARAQREHVVAVFIGYVRTVFAPRDCASPTLGRKP